MKHYSINPPAPPTHPLTPQLSALSRYPIFENPYPLSLHESPVTCCEYFADCPAELIPALYSVGSRQKRQGYSKKVQHRPFDLMTERS